MIDFYIKYQKIDVQAYILMIHKGVNKYLPIT